MACRPAALLTSADFWIGFVVGAGVVLLLSKVLGLF
jgi:hypothetical protein